MKKTTVLVFALLLAISVNAQWWGGKKIRGNGNMITKERHTSNYDKISISGSFDVELFSGKEGNITIEAEENLIEYIETEVKGDRLVVKFKDGISISHNRQILISIPFEKIHQLSLSGSGDIITKNAIKTESFRTSISGSGDIELEIDASNINASVSGSGDIILAGNTSDFKCSISGSGSVNANQLKSENVDANVAGSGSVKVHCNGELKARVAGSGSVIYTGNPTREDSKAAGSGRIRKG